MLLAAITVRQIIEIVVLFVVLNAVIVAPVIVAVIGALGERQQNQAHRPKF
jgi:hypothetical protein